MRYVEFYDWQYGYRKISSTKLFQEHFGMGLKEANERTNTLLDKQSFILRVESVEKADEVIKQFTEIGALCRLVELA
jgi:ribosomal protein L7/L12